MTAPDDAIWARWEEVDRTLAAALDVPPDEREAHVRRVAAEDPELGALLLRLLDGITGPEGANGEENGERVERPPRVLVDDAFPPLAPEPDLLPGTAVGRWTVLRPIGRGGMATVYEAERGDGTFAQRAALKVLRRGLDTADVVRRFVTERQILSSLEHPNIARILDGGTTPDGRPFFVMELVQGEPITAWAASRDLNVAQRLALFLGVADAVHAAHRRLVVHRDIKPSNVLVDDEGRVRLLDFGIAKLLEHDDEVTRAGSRALTPEYASPEQLRDDPITTASDVYQLGLLLHQMLTGGVPSSARALERPSRVAAERGEERLAHRLRGDIDLIVDKALRPEPESRYASADELAADVRRHLRGEPILAHPESATYRMRKFLGRNPLVMPSAIAAAALLATFVGTLAVQNRRLEAERDVAAAASRRAEQTQELFVNLLRSPDPYAPADPVRGREITVVEALRLGAARLEAEQEVDPILRSSLLGTIGSVFQSLGQYDDARAALDDAVALRAAAGDTTSDDFSSMLGSLAAATRAHGAVDSGYVIAERRLRLEQARDPTIPTLLGDALEDFANHRMYTDPAAGVALQEEAVRVFQAVGGMKLGTAMRTLADHYRAAGRHADSDSVARQALSILEVSLGPQAPGTAMALHTLGQTAAARRSFAEAASLLERSLAIFERDIGAEHPFTLSMRNNLGVMLLGAGEAERAERVFSDLVAIRTRVHGERHPEVAGTVQNRAAALLSLGRYEEAERLTRDAEAIYREVLPPGSIVVAFPLLTRSEIQLARRDYAAAHRSSAEVRTTLEGRLPPDHPALIVADCRRGRALAGLGQRSRARALLDSAVDRLASAEGVREEHRRECQEAREQLAR